MDRFEIYNLAERYMELINPISEEQLIRMGEIMELTSGSHVIDFGAGFAGMLRLWARDFGISGLGVEFRKDACLRARENLLKHGYQDQIHIVEGDASTYNFERSAFDVACCIGASFIWKGFRNTLKAMKEAIPKDGHILIAEPYWVHDSVPEEFKEREKDAVHTEFELLTIAREEGFDLKFISRATPEGWDHYESGNWRGLIQWLSENEDHPERDEVVNYLRKIQDDYLDYARKYVGLVILVLVPSMDLN